MIEEIGRIDRDTPPALLNEEGPWGPDDERAPGASEGGRRNPWRQPPRRRPRVPKNAGQPSLEELIRRGRDRLSGMPGGGRPIWGYALAAFVALWLASTMLHRIGPQDRGVVTRFGRYVDTLQPGIGVTLPAPIDVVTRVDIDKQRSFDAPASGANLLLTRDQSLVNLSYTVNWSVRDPELYVFEMPAAPEDVIRDAAASATREAVAGMTLDEVLGAGQGELGAKVTARLQELFDRYHSGVLVQGVTLRQADLPSQLSDAVKDIADAKAAVQTAVDAANRKASADIALARDQAATFDKLYAAYKLAPEVTRSRMYYGTMEQILAKSDKVVVDAPNVTVALPPPPAPAKQAQQGGGQ